MPTQYIFLAGGDACEVCTGLNGTVSDAPLGQIHDNCQCQSEPVREDPPCPTLNISDVATEQYGPGNRSVRVSAEVEVTCCDGTSNGASVEIDIGEADPSSLQDVISAIEAEAEGLAPDGCSEGLDIWFDEGEGALA